MSDEQFASAVDEMDRAERYAKAMMFASREAIRARSEEARLLEEATAKDERIKELKAVLAECATYWQHESAVHSGSDVANDALVLLAKVSP